MRHNKGKNCLSSCFQRFPTVHPGPTVSGHEVRENRGGVSMWSRLSSSFRWHAEKGNIGMYLRKIHTHSNMHSQ